MFAYAVRSGSLTSGGGGVRRSQLYFRLRRERAKIAAVLGEGQLADEALARRMGIATVRLQGLLGSMDARDVSLDDMINDNTTTTFVDRLAASSDPEESCFRAEIGDRLASAVQRALAQLQPRERFITEARLMADSTEELSLAEIGRRLGLSRERARQLETRAKQVLRAELASDDAMVRDLLTTAPRHTSC